MSKKLNLVLHCGGREVDYNSVVSAEPPPPSKRHYPIPHHLIYEQTEQALKEHGFVVVQSVFALAPGKETDNDRFFCLIELTNGNGDNDYRLVVGLRGSYDKVFAAALAAGAGVFVCDNLAFNGEVVFKRKNTLNAERDLPMVVEEAIHRLGALTVLQDRRIESYKDTTINDVEAHDLIVRCMDAGAYAPSKIPMVLKEWREPSYEEFKEDGQTLWRLYNGVTHNFKSSNPFTLSRRSRALCSVLDVKSGLVKNLEGWEEE